MDREIGTFVLIFSTSVEALVRGIGVGLCSTPRRNKIKLFSPKVKL